MNWTGGRLSRYSKANKSDALQRQRQYFARARQQVKRAISTSHPLFRPEWTSGAIGQEQLHNTHKRASASIQHKYKRHKEQQSLNEFEPTTAVARRLASILARPAADAINPGASAAAQSLHTSNNTQPTLRSPRGTSSRVVRAHTC
jgi:hypothetical protein